MIYIYTYIHLYIYICIFISTYTHIRGNDRFFSPVFTILSKVFTSRAFEFWYWMFLHIVVRDVFPIQHPTHNGSSDQGNHEPTDPPELEIQPAAPGALRCSHWKIQRGRGCTEAPENCLNKCQLLVKPTSVQSIDTIKWYSWTCWRFLLVGMLVLRLFKQLFVFHRTCEDCHDSYIFQWLETTS